MNDTKWIEDQFAKFGVLLVNRDPNGVTKIHQIVRAILEAGETAIEPEEYPGDAEFVFVAPARSSQLRH